MSRHSNPPQPVAYSYIRFSHAEQAKGDSIRRQTEATADWCRRNKVPLDASLTLQDKACSAFKGLHRENPDKHALALFLKLVERGRTRPGDYLVIENLDRLSREEEVPACHLLTGILMAGVRVVQLSPYEMLLTDKSNGWELMRAVMELSRGHGESAIKSERVGKAWREKKRRGREDGELITRRVPAWVEVRDGKPRLIPERAAVVRRIFELSIAGYGLAYIVAKFTREGVPAFGEYKVKEGRKRSQFSGHWNRTYIASILADRRAVGEFQPCRRDGTPDGSPIKGYFPAAVSGEKWHAARAAAEQRRRKPGRTSAHVNVFAGLLKDARGSGSYYAAPRGPRKEKYRRVLINTNGAEGREKVFSFPFDVFEEAIVSCLREVDPKEILEGTNGHDEVMALEGELGQVESAIASIVADLDAHGESPALYARLRAKEERQSELVERLAAASQKAANPLSAAWGEAQSLLDGLRSALDPEDARLRLRAALRRIVESMWLLVVPRGRDRLAVVQVRFSGGKRRDYIVWHRGGRGGAVAPRPSQWRVLSLATVARAGDLDLSKPAHAKRLEAVLTEMDLSGLDAEG